jgi:hypothetical protein
VSAGERGWEWNEEPARSYEEVVEQGGRVAEAMRAFRTFLGGSDMLAYPAIMALQWSNSGASEGEPISTPAAPERSTCRYCSVLQFAHGLE